MNLVITEKPSVAQDFAKALGNPEKKDGYIACGDYSITWAYGHLFELDDSPFNNGAWSLDSLPVLPDGFGYRAIEDKRKQISVIKKLLKEADRLIIAGDAGREGELIQREILISCGAERHPNAFRFWTSEALTPDVIRKCLKDLKPLREFDSLYFSAKARAESDWIVGINFSRLFSVLGNAKWTVGRVQTPTLNIIVSRDESIESFKPEKYFTITATFDKYNQKFTGRLINTKELSEEEKEEKERLDETTANEIIEKIQHFKTATVTNIKTETKKKNPPSLFSLTTLQRAANRIYGYNAQETLNIAQKLYETYKCISYPRTDSQHLAESSKQLAESKLQQFGGSLDVDVNRPGKRVFDDGKLTDHHAIIPLAPLDSNDPKDRNIYELVLNGFLAAFMKEYIYESTIYQLKVSDFYFQANGKKETQKGWKAIYQEQDEGSKNPENDIILPFLSVNDTTGFSDPTKNLKWTTPPSRMNEDSLLGIMDKIETYGLGTPATRASIIERLISVGYVIREKKNLISTPKGRELIHTLEGCQVKEATMTSSWEEKLDEIHKNKKGVNGYNHFMSDIKTYTSQEVEKYKTVDFKRTKEATPKMMDLAKRLSKEKNIPFDPKNNDFGVVNGFIENALKTPSASVDCPCGNGTLTQSPKAWTCSCGITIWKELFGKKLTESQVMKLFKGETIEVKDMTSRKGGKFSARAFYSKESKRVELKFKDQ